MEDTRCLGSRFHVGVPFQKKRQPNTRARRIDRNEVPKTQQRETMDGTVLVVVVVVFRGGGTGRQSLCATEAVVSWSLHKKRRRQNGGTNHAIPGASTPKFFNMRGKKRKNNYCEVLLTLEVVHHFVICRSTASPGHLDTTVVDLFFL